MPQLLRCLGFTGVALLCSIAAAEDPAAATGAETERAEEEAETFSILGERFGAFVGTESWSGLSSERIERTDARSAADVLRRAPAALVQTNSRGETLVYLRNAGERQVGVFLDGAPLNVPWDYRLDLNLIPGAVLDRIEVARGPLSNRYGPNVSGGALFLDTPAPRAPARQVARVEGGSAGLYRLEGRAAASFDDWGALLGAERMAYDGQPLATDATLPFSQSGELRTNTDRGRTSALGRIGGRLGDFELSMTTLYGRSRLGVAPEGHLDPADGETRYWRYPDSSLTMLIASAKGPLLPSLTLSATPWVQLFTQDIDSYASDAFEQLLETQRDRNRSVGSTLRLEQDFGDHRVATSFLGSLALHRQQIDDAETERFSSGLWSAGLDHSFARGPFMTRVGVGLDGLSPQDTGGRESGGALRAWNASGGVRWEPLEGAFLRLALGSRARLPTMRELYGTALDRFVLNPELEAERNHTVELGAGLEDRRWALELIGFARWTDDTLAQEIVDVEGLPRRRRVNLGSSQVIGAELVGRATLLDWLVLGGHVVASDVRATDVDGTSTRLAERPELQGFVELVLGHAGSGPELTLEGFARAEAYSLTSTGFVRLPDSFITNARIAYRLTAFDALELSAHVRVDNLFDSEVVPQIGLPDPGRWFRAGLSLAL